MRAAQLLLEAAAGLSISGATFRTPPSPTSRPNPQPQNLPATCRDEWQRVMCSDIPSDETPQLLECCSLNRPRRRPPPTAAAMRAGQDIPRPDLKSDGGAYSAAPRWEFGNCTAKKWAPVPEFIRSQDGHVTRVSHLWVAAPSIHTLKPRSAHSHNHINITMNQPSLRRSRCGASRCRI